MTGSRTLKRREPATVTDDNTALKRLSMSDKHAVVQQVRRLGAGQRALGSHVKVVAGRHGISPKTVYRWMNDPRFATDTTPSPSTRGRFEVTTNHLAVLAHEQCIYTAWLTMHEAGLIDCSYRTFTRALQERTDPALVAAALHGFKGLVNNRLYLKWNPPHRCHTHHVDHTEFDLWVWPSHKHRSPVRPHVTVIVDGYSSLIHAVPWVGDINGDMVAAALADAAVEHDYMGTPVGGQPEQVVLDNAAAHFGPSMRDGIERVGWIPAPTASYSSWQNGKAERSIGLLNERLSNRAPGATKSGTTRTGAPRNVAKLPKDVQPGDVWGWKAFQHALQETVDEINTSIPVRRLGGLTRLQAYAADTTERRPMKDSEARIAMMTSGHITYTASKNGIHFQGVDYVGSKLQFGKKYLIRYLPTQREFIEVMDLHDEHVQRAYDPHRMPKKVSDAFHTERARQERDAQAIEFGVQAHRRHLAAVDNANVGYGEDTDPGPTKAVDSVDRSHGDRAVPKTSRRKAAKLPRIPATPQPKDTVTSSARSRLERAYGQGLNGPTATADNDTPPTPTDHSKEPQR
ncbi:DDE-type integrase/transposase/recombinase [Nocardioides aurantiacus]|uniref:Integrase-like protein n=1 Tax=Nocardioides aurantiacus TaxID=86796 RepID=A0A3N2CTZ3_9ACTN|nr:DDE-type integrase/transposase/recombinase [Nocardioides aurantiacus]ROR90981.1 integrase-like protein [Nocardioides aurantiacus]